MKYLRFLFFITILFIAYRSSFCVTHIDITRSNISPVPIALHIYSKNQEYKEITRKIESVIAKDLISSGLFRLIEKDAYIENIDDINYTPNFPSWRQINTTALIAGEVSKTQNNKIKMHFKMWDVFSQKQINNKSLSSNLSIWRRISHKTADIIYKKLTGEEGYFDSKIAYVSIDDHKYGEKVRKLAIVDQDGENLRYLTKGDNMVLTPRFSPDAKYLLYLEYSKKSKPKVRLMDIERNTSKVIGSFAGMSYAPRYTNSGKSALMSVEKGGISNIHYIDLTSMKSHQLTFCSSVCVSPSSSPNQKKIVFNSDMGGNKQLYTMNFDGSNIKRITFGDGSYSTPVWSPRGDLIAFTKMVPGEGFYIGVIKPDGSNERIIASGWLVEGPAWSPNGRVIMFEKEMRPGFGSKIYTIDITGHNEQMLETRHNASDASWSNLLD